LTELKCGRIRYTNDLPIYAAFDAKAIAYPGSLHADVPSRLNAMMRAGELDVSPISAFAYASEPERYVLLPDLCIGARDEVWSVVCVSRAPLAELDGATIAVTRESASGRNLLRVLLDRRYGVRAQIHRELASRPTGKLALYDPKGKLTATGEGALELRCDRGIAVEQVEFERVALQRGDPGQPTADHASGRCAPGRLAASAPSDALVSTTTGGSRT